MGLGDRICFRVKSRFPVFHKDPDASRWAKAVSTDLSTSGIGILTRQTLEKESVLDLRLGIPGRIRKITLQGRVARQRPAQEKNRKLLLTGIRFEKVSEKAADTITKFILKQLSMPGIRTLVLLTGLTAFTASLFRFLYYSVLNLFQGTAFGKEWLTGTLESLPSERIAYFYAALAVLVLVACLCFFFMKKHASLGVLLAATVGLLDQSIRCVLKIPCLLHGLPGARIFLAEAGLLILWGVLGWAMVRHGEHYERLLESMHEDAGFQPSSPEPPPEEMPPVHHVFLP